MKHEDAYLKDQQFEFAASQYIFIYLYITVLPFALLLNKLLNFIYEDQMCLWTLYNIRIQIGVGETEPRRANSITVRVPRKELIHHGSYVKVIIYGNTILFYEK